MTFRSENSNLGRTFLKTTAFTGRRRTFSALSLLLLLLPGLAAAQPIKTATYELGTFTNTQLDWVQSNFKTIVNSDYSVTDSQRVKAFTGSLWTTYLDITTLSTLSQYLDMADWAAKHGVSPEEMLLHAKIDYTASIGTPWQYIDKFDAFEGANGVLVEAAGILTDKTAVAYSGASPYTTVNGNLYIGYELPFDQATITIKTAAVSLSGSWQYWNGTSNSWTNLSVTDGTSAMTTTGMVSFVPPSDWGRTSIKNSRNKFFIRFAYKSAAANPVIATIKGDNWVNGAANQCRGWNPQPGAALVNIGGFAYNPTPPPGASARFKYQSRVPTWSVNHFIFNIADRQTVDGVANTRTCSEYLADSTIRSVNAIPYTGMMYDDGIFPSTFGSIGISSTDFVDKTANNVTVEGLARWSDLYNKVKSSMPTLSLGLNAYRKDYVRVGDFNLYEYFNYTYGTGDQDSTKLSSTDNSVNMCYDDYLPGVNSGKNIHGIMIYQDSSSIVNGYSWDQANRGPLVALTKHLIGWNDNTSFAYFSNGSAMYSERDDFYYTDDSKTSLTSPLVRDTSTVAKAIRGADFSFFDVSNCIVIGTGDTREVIRPSNLTITKTNSTTLTTTSKIWFDHAAGEPVQFCRRGHLTTDPLPSQEKMVRWGNWFPAMDVDFGAAGARNLAWAVGAKQNPPWTNYTAYGNPVNTNVWSRDYEKALVLHRPNGGASSVVDYGTYSAPLPLGGTYYPLNADGTTGAAITSIALRRGEGAILMKQQFAAPVSTPPATPYETPGNLRWVK